MTARFAFDAAMGLAILFAAVMVVHRHPVKSVLALVVSFFALAVGYVLLSAPLIAAIQAASSWPGGAGPTRPRCWPTTWPTRRRWRRRCMAASPGSMSPYLPIQNEPRMNHRDRQAS